MAASFKFIATNGIPVVIQPIPEKTPASDFIFGAEDIVEWRFHATGYGTNFHFRDGILMVSQYTSEDRRLLHELGHLLTLPIDRWWYYNLGHVPFTPHKPFTPFDFKLRNPTTVNGLEKACINEIRAIIVENILTHRYGIAPTWSRASTVNAFRQFCENRHSHIKPPPTVQWIETIYEEMYQMITFEWIMETWERIVAEMRIKSMIHRSHTLIDASKENAEPHR